MVNHSLSKTFIVFFLLVDILLIGFSNAQISNYFQYNISSVKSAHQYSGTYIASIADRQGDYGVLYHPDQNGKNQMNVYNTKHGISSFPVEDGFIPMCLSGNATLFVNSQIKTSINPQNKSSMTSTSSTTSIVGYEQTHQTQPQEVQFPMNNTNNFTAKIRINDCFTTASSILVLYSFRVDSNVSVLLYRGLIHIDKSNLQLKDITITQQQINASNPNFLVIQDDLKFASSSLISGYQSFTYLSDTGASVIEFMNYTISNDAIIPAKTVSTTCNNDQCNLVGIGGHAIDVIQNDNQSLSFVAMSDNHILLQHSFVGNSTLMAVYKVSTTEIVVPQNFDVTSKLASDSYSIGLGIQKNSYYYYYNTGKPHQLQKISTNPFSYKYFQFYFTSLYNGYITIIVNLPQGKNSVSNYFTLILDNTQIQLAPRSQTYILFNLIFLNNTLLVLVILYQFRKKELTGNDLYPLK